MRGDGVPLAAPRALRRTCDGVKARSSRKLDIPLLSPAVPCWQLFYCIVRLGLHNAVRLGGRTASSTLRALSHRQCDNGNPDDVQAFLGEFSA